MDLNQEHADAKHCANTVEQCKMHTMYNIIYLVLRVFCFFLKLSFLFFFFFQRQSDEFRLYVYKQLDIQELLEMKGVSGIQAIARVRGHHRNWRVYK